MAKMGRLSDAVKHHFEEILNSPSGYAKFKRIMSATKNEKAYLEYFKECMDRKFGKAPQFTEMELNDISKRPSLETLESIARRAGISVNGDSVDKGE